MRHAILRKKKEPAGKQIFAKEKRRDLNDADPAA
jgi:hypothetical protein